jgi:hypothetical protein
MTTRLDIRPRAGFTLIELLVVGAVRGGRWGRPGVAPARTNGECTFPDTGVRYLPQLSRGSTLSPTI